MREYEAIADLADPEIPVPPRTYGGIEGNRGPLVRSGQVRWHDVALVAHRDSTAPLRFYPGRGRFLIGAWTP